MSTGMVLNIPIKVPLGKYASIIAPKGSKVEVTDWDTDDKGCYQVKITLYVSGFPIAYEGPLHVGYIDMDWSIIEKRFRRKYLKDTK